MIENAFIIAMVVYFIHATFWPTQIFGGIALWLEDRMPEKLTMPLFNCPICMTPWWGTLIYLIGGLWDNGHFKDQQLETIILTVFCAAGINTILLQFNRIADVMKDSYEDFNEPKVEE